MTSSRFLILTGITVAHCAMLALVILAPGHITPPMTLPTVQGILIATAAATAAELPRPRMSPTAPRPEPVALPLPPPKMPSSERAITVPAAEPKPIQEQEGKGVPTQSMALDKAGQSQQHAEDAGPKSTAGTAAAAGVPLTLPRVDAGHLNNPVPVYPSLSRRLGEQGQVLLDVLILPDGTVGDIRLKTSSRYSRLDNAALNAVKRWRYLPARRGNTPIAYWYVQPVVFTLQN